jgi:hypothetical protein
MFPFSSSRINKDSLSKNKPPKINKPQKKARVPYHFTKNSIINYSQSEIKKQLKKYPGLLKTLAHAYQYEIIFINPQQEKQYWFCRNLEVTMPLLKYLNEKNWSVDWQERPFRISEN